MTDEITRYKNRQKLQEQFVAIAEYVQLLWDNITQLEKENAGLKKNIERYSQKIAEQEETIDAQDDKINFYVAKMNENILKRQELEKENEQLKNKINCPMVNKCGMLESTK